MKHRTLIFIIILLLLLLPSQFLLLKTPIYPSHDALFHIERIKQFNLAIREGQFPPRLAPTLAGGIGYPLFVVNYQLPYYFAQLFMLPKGDATFAFKATMATSFILSAFAAFLLFRQNASNLASLTAAIVFSYLPYRFANLYARGSLGESTALMFVPLVLLSVHLIAKRRKLGNLLLALSVFGLVTSHTVIFLLFAPFFVAYALLMIKPSRFILGHIILGSLLGLTLASFQLLPALFEKSYLKFDQNLSGLFQGHFVSLAQLLRLPQEGVNIGTPFQIGAIALPIVILSLIILATKRPLALLLFLSFILISTFLITSPSVWFWRNLPLLPYILYPWRFLSVIVLSLAFLSAYLVDQVKARLVVATFLIAATIFTSRHYFLKPSQLESGRPTENLTTQNEYDPIWARDQTFINRPLITSKPQAKIAKLEEKPFMVSFEALVDQPTDLIIRRLYFPGWQLKVNNQNHQLAPSDGLLSFNLPSGNWQVKAYFTQTPLRKIADTITVVSMSLLALIALKQVKKICFTHQI